MFEIFNNENIKISIDYPYVVEDYVNFLLKIKIANFYGEHNFCICKNELQKAILELDSLFNKMVGEVKLSDYDSESYIYLKMDNNQMVSLRGQLGSEWEDNLWIFKLEVDKTIIKLLISNFNKLIRI